mmetsp:Transcript_20768/g.52657  ORF Transcript_20768/g.52657 Transcript_20768/m.52657 type:complete len:97 (-) Transcript_20768:91-381(-)
MMACFGGMLLSSQGAINSCGWLLLTAVLLDTFVVNTVLVPALMSIGDKVAWWPTKMPMEGLITLDHPEFGGDDLSGKPSERSYSSDTSGSMEHGDS